MRTWAFCVRTLKILATARDAAVAYYSMIESHAVINGKKKEQPFGCSFTAKEWKRRDDQPRVSGGRCYRDVSISFLLHV